MADGIIQVAPDSTAKKLDTSELTVGANTVERERIVIADPTTAGALGAVLNANPAGTEYAPVVRPIMPQDAAARTPVVLYLDEITGITSEALATMNINKGGSTSTATSYTVTTGKTLRVQAVIFSCLNSSTTAVKGRLRLRSAATVLATSPVFCSMVCGGVGAVANEGSETSVNFSDGLEFAAGQQVGLSHLESSTSSTVSACIVGYEY